MLVLVEESEHDEKGGAFISVHKAVVLHQPVNVPGGKLREIGHVVAGEPLGTHHCGLDSTLVTHAVSATVPLDGPVVHVPGAIGRNPLPNHGVFFELCVLRWIGGLGAGSRDVFPGQASAQVGVLVHQLFSDTQVHRDFLRDGLGGAWRAVNPHWSTSSLAPDGLRLYPRSLGGLDEFLPLVIRFTRREVHRI